MRFMNSSLEKLVDSLSEINTHNKEMKEFDDNIMAVQNLVTDYSTIDKKETTKITTNMKSMITTLSTFNNSYPDKENEFITHMKDMINTLATLINEYSNMDSDFTTNMRSMITQLTQLFSEYKEIKEKILLIDLKKRYPNVYKLSKGDADKFLLLLRKGAYPYNYMDSWERFNETKIPPRKEFYNQLTQEDITEEDYNHAVTVWNTFNLKNLGEYHDLYVQVEALQLSDVFGNFRDTCQEIYQLDPAYFVSAPGLAWQACLKKTNVNLELLRDINMLLMIEKGIRGGICQSIHRRATANNKYMKDYDENVESSYLQNLDANSLYGWEMSKKLPIGEFNWDDPKNYSEEFIKNYDENSDHGAFLRVDVEYPIMTKVKHKDIAF